MGSLARKMERNKQLAQEKEEIKKIKTMYGQRPKGTCPKCHKASLFYTNKDGETFCVRCDNKVGVKNESQ